MKKYFKIFLLELQVQFQYKANLVLWLLLGFMSTSIIVMVWLAILGERDQLMGFTESDFVIYYVYMVLSWYVIGGAFSRQLGKIIKMGEISKTLIKPYSVLIEEVVKEQAWKVMSLVVTLPAIFTLMVIFSDFLNLETKNIALGPLLLSIVLGAILFASIEAVIGCLAFWVTEVWPFADLYNILLNMFGGIMAPLTILPNKVQMLANILPFKYIFYGPASIMLGKTGDGWEIILPQLGYVIIFQVILHFVWHAGLKRYEGNGG